MPSCPLTAAFCTNHSLWYHSLLSADEAPAEYWLGIIPSSGGLLCGEEPAVASLPLGDEVITAVL